MTRPNLLQQRYSVIVRKPDGTNPLDITEDVDNVSLEIDQNMITVLTFELRKPDKYSGWLDSNYRIEFYGGYLGGNDYFDLSENQKGLFYEYKAGSANEHFKYMYRGTVWRIVYSYSDSGVKTANVESKDFSWGATSFQKINMAYPSKKATRTFATTKTKLKLSEIVKGIADDIKLSTVTTDSNNIEVSTIQVHVDTEYTIAHPAIQHNVTDWYFLRVLASENACNVWTNIDPSTGKYSLYFVDKDKSRNLEEKQIEFIWLDRTDGYDFKNTNVPTGDEASEFSRLKPNQIQILSANVEIAPTLLNSAVTQVTEFNEETGQDEQKLVSYREEGESIIYYELKTELVAGQSDETLKKLSNMGPFGIPWEVAKDYYKEVPFPKGVIKAIDRPFHGITVTAKITGNVNIEPFQSYRIFGIGKWSTRDNSKGLRYYCHGITHNWGSEGFFTDLRFKA